MTGRTAGVPAACPATVTVDPCSGPKSLNRQSSAYWPEPKSMSIGLTVPGPVFSISAYTAPLAGSTRSISPPPVPWLLIWMVCQPGPGTDQAPPHSLLLTVITFDGWPRRRPNCTRRGSPRAPRRGGELHGGAQASGAHGHKR